MKNYNKLIIIFTLLFSLFFQVEKSIAEETVFTFPNVNSSPGSGLSNTDNNKVGGGNYSLKSSWYKKGTWTITGLIIGKPLYIIHKHNGNSENEVRFDAGINTSRFSYTLGHTYINGVDYTSSNVFIIIPDSNVYSLYIKNMRKNSSLHAYQ